MGNDLMNVVNIFMHKAMAYPELLVYKRVGTEQVVCSKCTLWSSSSRGHCCDLLLLLYWMKLMLVQTHVLHFKLRIPNIKAVWYYSNRYHNGKATREPDDTIPMSYYDMARCAFYTKPEQRCSRCVNEERAKQRRYRNTSVNDGTNTWRNATVCLAIEQIQQRFGSCKFSIDKDPRHKTKSLRIKNKLPWDDATLIPRLCNNAADRSSWSTAASESLKDFRQETNTEIER